MKRTLGNCGCCKESLKSSFSVVMNVLNVRYSFASSLAERRKQFDKYKQQTRADGLNAHLVFVEKPFIKLASDWERNEFFYQSGDLAGFYHDWEILQCKETIIDCDSAGVPHRHAMNGILARKIET